MTEIKLKDKYLKGYIIKKTKFKAKTGNFSGVIKHRKKHRLKGFPYHF